MPDPSGASDKASHSSASREDDDRALIGRVAQKDRQAFETLYYHYAPRLGSYLSRLLKQRDLVEEVINDVMLVVWQNAARFDPSRRLSTWLFGIAHHKALKALARSSKQRFDLPLDPHGPPDDSEEPHDYPHDPHNPEQTMLHQDLSRTLSRALEALSPEHRAVVELAFYEEFSYQEIATITGCPVNTVKTRMFYARKRLAQILVEWGLGSNEREESL
jgi:RNA polymerase sigma-70 factor (ECF subfamily)